MMVKKEVEPMKRIIVVALVITMLFAFSGCDLLKMVFNTDDLESLVKVDLPGELQEDAIFSTPTEQQADNKNTATVPTFDATEPPTTEATEAPTTEATQPTQTERPATPSGVNLLDSFNGEERYQINVFLSNFSEQSFKSYPCSDREMVDFGFIYAKINNREVFYSKDGYYCVDKVNMDSILKRFFGKTANIPSADNYMHYSDGTYYFPAADGESYAYCSFATNMVSLGNGTYQVEFAVYGNVNPHDSMSAFYRMTPSQAAYDSRLEYLYSGTAVVKDYLRSNGVESYQLISYNRY